MSKTGFFCRDEAHNNERRHEKTNVLVSDLTRDTNQAVQLQKMARGLKFQI